MTVYHYLLLQVVRNLMMLGHRIEASVSNEANISGVRLTMYIVRFFHVAAIDSPGDKALMFTSVFVRVLGSLAIRNQSDVNLCSEGIENTAAVKPPTTPNAPNRKLRLVFFYCWIRLRRIQQSLRFSLRPLRLYGESFLRILTITEFSCTSIKPTYHLLHDSLDLPVDSPQPDHPPYPAAVCILP